ncbi:MAG: hypothetical protein V2B19_03675 [Pseudomonadota bacterium]
MKKNTLRLISNQTFFLLSILFSGKAVLTYPRIFIRLAYLYTPLTGERKRCAWVAAIPGE